MKRMSCSLNNCWRKSPQHSLLPHTHTLPRGIGQAPRPDADVVIYSAEAGDTEKHSLLKHIHTNHYPSYDIIKPGELIDSCFPGLKDLEKERNGVYFLKNEKLSELITEVDQFKEILKSYNSE